MPIPAARPCRPTPSRPGRAQSGSYGARLAVAPARSTDTICYQCHADVRGQFSLPSHHPAPEGKLDCTDCHSPHKGSIMLGGGTSILSENEMCEQCHAEQRGPFVFEHEALREGCTVCHTPHGSVNSKLLTVRDANLCLRCHFQQQSGGTLLIGGSITPPRSAKAPAGRRAATRRCMVRASAPLCDSNPEIPSDEITEVFREAAVGWHGLVGGTGRRGRQSLAAADTNAPPALTPEQMFEGGTNTYNNWIDFTAGGAFVSGNRAQFQQQHQIPAGAFGGMSDFHYQTGIATNTTLTLDGHAHRGQHDYKLALDIQTRESRLFAAVL